MPYAEYRSWVSIRQLAVLESTSGFRSDCILLNMCATGEECTLNVCTTHTSERLAYLP